MPKWYKAKQIKLNWQGLKDGGYSVSQAGRKNVNNSSDLALK